MKMAPQSAQLKLSFIKMIFVKMIKYNRINLINDGRLWNNEFKHPAIGLWPS